MRLGSYAVTDDNGSSLDVSVSALPGDSGGLEANVKRWLGQIDVELAEDEALAAYVSDAKVDDLPAHLVRAENEEKGQALRVLTFTAKGKRWFFKIIGDAALAEQEEANFRQFFASVTFAHAHHGHDHDHAGHDHHGHDHAGHAHDHAAPEHNGSSPAPEQNRTHAVTDHNDSFPAPDHNASQDAAPERNRTDPGDHNHSHDE